MPAAVLLDIACSRITSLRSVRYRTAGMTIPQLQIDRMLQGTPLYRFLRSSGVNYVYGSSCV
jgi:hypothetical protein